MSENSLPEQEALGRRQFLKRAVGVGGAVIGATALAEHEVKTGIEGVQTSVGIFIPLYERHDIGLSPKDVPDDLDFKSTLV